MKTVRTQLLCKNSLRKYITRVLTMLCCVSILFLLFGCETHKYPFDVDKAYCTYRQGVIAGGDFTLEYEPQGIVECYSYEESVKENSGDGMRDRGATLYFVGLKEGTVKVSTIHTYPTMEDRVETFTLKVDSDLCVTRID